MFRGGRRYAILWERVLTLEVRAPGDGTSWVAPHFVAPIILLQVKKMAHAHFERPNESCPAPPCFPAEHVEGSGEAEGRRRVTA